MDDSADRDVPDYPGPTDEPYPPGARPAGPGAEAMTAEPSESRSSVEGSSDGNGDPDTLRKGGP